MIKKCFFFASVLFFCNCGEKSTTNNVKSPQIKNQNTNTASSAIEAVKTPEAYEFGEDLEGEYYKVDGKIKEMDANPDRSDIVTKMSDLDAKIKKSLDKDENIKLRLERQKLRTELSLIDKESRRDSLIKVKNFLVTQLK